MIPNSYRVEARSAPRPKTRGVRPGELATGGRALRPLPERNEDRRVRTAHHRSVILFSWVGRVGENSFRGFFELTGEGSTQLATRRKGQRVRPVRRQASRVAVSAQSKTVFCGVARASLASERRTLPATATRGVNRVTLHVSSFFPLWLRQQLVRS